MTKTCRKCGETKEAREFGRNPRTRDQLSSWCRACHNLAAKAWRERNREQYNARRRVVPLVIRRGGGRPYVQEEGP